MASVESRIKQGAVWDGLAALRRGIEQQLVNLARERGLAIPQKYGAGALLQLLRQNDVLPQGVADELRDAVMIANRGVHGMDVGVEEALEASRNTKSAFAKLHLSELP